MCVCAISNLNVFSNLIAQDAEVLEQSIRRVKVALQAELLVDVADDVHPDFGMI